MAGFILLCFDFRPNAAIIVVICYPCQCPTAIKLNILSSGEAPTCTGECAQLVAQLDGYSNVLVNVPHLPKDIYRNPTSDGHSHSFGQKFVFFTLD